MGELAVVAGGKREGFIHALPGGLPVYGEPTIEGVESTWTVLDEQEDRIQFKRGAIAHAISLNRTYGEADLRQFAGRMNVAYSTVCDWLATYRRLLRLPDAMRARVMALDLRYAHFRALCGVVRDADFEMLLNEVHEKRLSFGKTYALLHNWRMVNEAQPGFMCDTSAFHDGPDSFFEDEADELYTATAAAPAQVREAQASYELEVIDRFISWCAEREIFLTDAEGNYPLRTRLFDEYVDSALG